MVKALAALNLIVLLAILILLGLFLRREAPLVHTAMWNFSESSYNIGRRSEAQLRETEKATKDLHEFIFHTDCQLNGCKGPHLQVIGILPKASAALDGLPPLMQRFDSAMVHLDQAIEYAGDDTKELHSTILVLNKSITDLDQVISDPNIKETLAALRATVADIDADSQQLNALLKSSTATAEDVRRVADKIAEEYTKARNLYYAIFKEVLAIGSQGVQFALPVK